MCLPGSSRHDAIVLSKRAGEWQQAEVTMQRKALELQAQPRSCVDARDDDLVNTVLAKVVLQVCATAKARIPIHLSKAELVHAQLP